MKMPSNLMISYFINYSSEYPTLPIISWHIVRKLILYNWWQNCPGRVNPPSNTPHRLYQKIIHSSYAFKHIGPKDKRNVCYRKYYPSVLLLGCTSILRNFAFLMQCNCLWMILYWNGPLSDKSYFGT